MPIAVLGWGSLLWNQGALQLSSRWYADGPSLPLEFARVSTDGRLTLVLHDPSPLQQTYWARSPLATLPEVRANLQTREGCPRIDPIHGLSRDGRTVGVVPEQVRAVIAAWLAQHADLDGVIWTGLGERWPGDVAFGVDAAIAHLRGLKGAVARDAQAYIRKAPPQIQTPVRARVRSDLGWDDIPLDASVLAGDKASVEDSPIVSSCEESDNDG
jgi:hypothetical protein